MVCIVIKNIINRLSIVCCVQAKKGEEDGGEGGKSAANNKTCLTLIAVGNTIQTTIIFHLEDICLRSIQCVCLLDCFMPFVHAVNFHFDHPPYSPYHSR